MEIIKKDIPTLTRFELLKSGDVFKALGVGFDSDRLFMKIEDVKEYHSSSLNRNAICLSTGGLWTFRPADSNMELIKSAKIIY